MYDAVIIGCGPSGLMAGHFLLNAGATFLILDKGKKNREHGTENSADASFGFGGGGLFSDGKFSYYPAASWLWGNIDKVRLKHAYLELKKIFSSCGVNIYDWNDKWVKESFKNQEGEKKYESDLIEPYYREKILDYFYEELKSNICFEKNVISVEKREDGYAVIYSDWDGNLGVNIGAEVSTADLPFEEKQEKNRTLESLDINKNISIKTRTVIIATGKSSAHEILKKNDIGWHFIAEMGVRAEADKRFFIPYQNNRSVSKENDKCIDYKLRSPLSFGDNGSSEIRTFCFCDNGIIRKSLYDDTHTTYNGERTSKDGGLNIGAVIRIFDENNILASEMKASYGRTDSVQCPLNEFGANSRSWIIGQNSDEKLRDFLLKLFSNPQKTTVVGPEIEKFGYYPELNTYLEASAGLYFSGDSTAMFRGLLAAFISGGVVADEIVEEYGYGNELLKGAPACLDERSALTTNTRSISYTSTSEKGSDAEGGYNKKQIDSAIESLKVHISSEDKLPVIFTAQSKKFFYCRDAVCEYVFKRNGIPVNPFRIFGYFLGDRVDRDVIRRANNNLLRRCDELWVFGDTIADGVMFEITSAMKQGKTIRFFTIDARAEDIKEVNVDDLKFEPEVHASGVRKKELIHFLKTGEIPEDSNMSEYLKDDDDVYVDPFDGTKYDKGNPRQLSFFDVYD